LLAPFVEHYNAVKGTQFLFAARLDRTGPEAQPEAEYRDATTGSKLVIERKSIIYPRDFAQLHQTLHELSGTLDRPLADILDASRAYRLIFNKVRGNRTEMKSLAEIICERITADLALIHQGYEITDPTPGREWIFYEEREFDRDYFEPGTGVIYEFKGERRVLDLDSEAPGDLLQDLSKHLQSASRKFAPHPDATRLLALDTFGALQIMTDFNWDVLLRNVTIPENIDEIWLTKHAMITDMECGWVFQRLKPERNDAQYTLCHDSSARAKL
jgi:hypothetical protein